MAVLSEVESGMKSGLVRVLIQKWVSSPPMQRKETLGQKEQSAWWEGPGSGAAWNCVCLQVGGEEEDLECRGTLHCSQIFVLIWGTPSYHWVLSGLVGGGRS